MQESPIRLLIVAVVQEQDLDAVMRALQEIGVPATYFSSAGGFLGRRNATLLIGLPDGQEPQTLDILHQTCRQRVEYMTMPLEGTPMPMPAPVPVTVGGATVFTLPVERFEQI